MRPIRLAVGFLGLASLLAAQPAKPIGTTVCDILRTPEQFDGKMLQVRATIVSRFEYSGLDVSHCNTKSGIWLSFGYSPFNPETTESTTEFARIESPEDVKQPGRLQWRELRDPAPLKFQEDSHSKRMDEYLNQNYKRKDGRPCWTCPLYRVTATFTGRLDYSGRKLTAYRQKGTSEIKTWPAPGFGHLNASPMQFVAVSVTDVTATPIDPGIYEPK